MIVDGRSGMSRATFVLESLKLQKNLTFIKSLASSYGVKWLYTLKAFDKVEGLKLISDVFDGFSVGNLYEYQKVKEYSSHIHTYAPAYELADIQTLAQCSDTMSFNSLSQYHRYANISHLYTSIGLRINPKLKLKQPSYCDNNVSHLGVDWELFLQEVDKLSYLEGLHFHAFCSQDIEAFEMLISHIQQHYKLILKKLKWINLGGGLNLTDESFDVKRFEDIVKAFHFKYPNIQIYFEPASSLLKGCGYLECEVVDIIDSSRPTAILNTSIEAHMLDVAITKQKPKVKGSISLQQSTYKYRLAGMSCIAGDIIGDYGFSHPLKIGDRVVFEDMLAYTLVKQTSFNGIKEACFCIR